eukprot:CAMPEP_0113891782 /NCGR_PEP_ID=MMETSP0780_2-20120614/14981_1 /TAXON_ID=652834 /ORGANISM="Palpitomonas bilix" /LENGTH=43 /DNA_ID=CAMNT_0000881505 /DNA_START=133 /DNA_END=264 /DNA_ORIENTATION=+ /assembly_acc=CAM_ASM_000599
MCRAAAAPGTLWVDISEGELRYGIPPRWEGEGYGAGWAGLEVE